MPLWTIHHTPGIFSEEEKHQLACSPQPTLKQIRPSR